MQNFQALGTPPPDPRVSSGWGLCPQTPNSLWRLGAQPPDPQDSPSESRISSYAPATLRNVYNYTGVGSFCFEQFFLHCSVANLMMLTVDVRLMLNCFLVEKYLLHYAVCDFDFILLHCTKLFIRQI